MTYYGVYQWRGSMSVACTTVVGRLTTEPGWSVTHVGATDGAGHVVSVAENVDNGYVLVGWTHSSISSRQGRFTIAESYDFASGTVTNPAVLGAWNPLAGDVAYDAPVPLLSLTNAAYSGASYSNNSYYKYINAMMVNRDAIAFSVSWRYTTTTWRRESLMAGAFTSLCPTLEATFAPKAFFYTTGRGLGLDGGRVNRSPLSSTAPAATNWTVALSPWHTLGYYGTDRFAVDPTGLPSTRAAVYRTSGSDGYGNTRGLLTGFRWGNGSQGQQITDEDGDVWEWRYGSVTEQHGSGTVLAEAAGAGPFSGWWRVG